MLGGNKKMTKEISDYVSKVSKLAIDSNKTYYLQRFFDFKSYLPSSKPLLMGHKLPEKECLGIVNPTYVQHQEKKYEISFNYVLDFAKVNGDLK